MGAGVATLHDFIDARGDRHAVLGKHGAKRAAAAQPVGMRQVDSLAQELLVSIHFYQKMSCGSFVYIGFRPKNPGFPDRSKG